MIFEPCFCYSEVDDSHFDADFGKIVRVGELCGHVKLETLSVVNVAVTKTNNQTTSLKIISDEIKEL